MAKNDELRSSIPLGMYCYEFTGELKGDGTPVINVCPYWSRDNTKPEQMNGYCSYLDIGDWEGPGFGLLWDMVKECGINEEPEE